MDRGNEPVCYRLRRPLSRLSALTQNDDTGQANTKNLTYPAAWIGKWQAKYPRLVAWAEENIEETLTFYRLPRQHHKHLKSTNMLERLNEEIKRRTHVVRIFPNAESCLRLIRALCVETHENWLEAHRYLNMDYLRELKKQALRNAA
jgi:transposase-like protein